MAEILKIGPERVALFMDAEEAGFLRDVMHRFTAGTLTVGSGPLARIRRALLPVSRRRALVVSTKHGYPVLEPYATLEEEAYALNKLFDDLGGVDF